VKSVITSLEPNREEMLLGFTPYKLEIKGEPEPRVKVVEIKDITTGAATIRIVAMAAAGMPVLALPTLDQIARRILPNARVTARLHGSAAFTRLYSA
jgi:hypothetical protein